MAGKKEAVEQTTWPFIGMTVPEAAAALRVHKRTILMLIRDRGLPARKVGSQWRISPAAVEAWLASGNGATETDNNEEIE